MDSVTYEKVVEDYDNKIHKDVGDDDVQTEAMLLADEKLQKTGSVTEKDMGLVVGGIHTVEVNKGCVHDPRRVVEPECYGTVENEDQGLVMKNEMGLAVGGVNTVEVNKGCVDDPGRVVEPECDGTVENKDQVSVMEKEMGLVVGGVNTVEVNKVCVDDPGRVVESECDGTVENENQGLVMKREMGLAVGGVNTVEVNKGCVDDPGRVVEPECDGTVENEDQVSVMEKEMGLVVGGVNTVEVNKGCVDDPGRVVEPECDGTVENGDQGSVMEKEKGVVVGDVNTVEVNKGCVDDPGRVVEPEYDGTVESDDQGLVMEKGMGLVVGGVNTVEANKGCVDDPGRVVEPECGGTVDQGLATTKHITEESNDADVPEVTDNCRDVANEHKVCEESAKEGVVNNRNHDTCGVAEKGKRDVDAADLVDITSLNIDDQRSVDMPPNTVETNKKNDGPNLNEADIKTGLATTKHITEKSNDADVPEVTDNCRDVVNEHKVWEESAKEGVVNNKNHETCGVAEKCKRDVDAADLVDITSLNIDDQRSVDMPPLTVETNKKNDGPNLNEADIKTVTAGDTPYTSVTAFEDLNLSAELLRGVYTEMGFERPSKIQAITLPMILTRPYLNLVAQAQNGSGKTTCFVLGMLSRIDPKVAAPQALCVCPTRELALQNWEVVKKMGKHIGIGSICAVPTDIGSYVATSRRAEVNEQVIIGTPGTVKKWISNKVLRTRYIKILVFDEADHMLAQDGFQDDSMRVIRDIQKNQDSCQILLFSATFNDSVKMFIRRMIPIPNQVFVKEEDLSLDSIKQYFVKCPNELAKIEVLKDRIFPLAEKLGQTIIFVRTRESASKLHSILEEEGHKCTSMQGRLKLEDRDCIIAEFRSGITRILISTDVIARGFDQAQVTLVVNFDLPVKVHSPDEPDYEVYLHRIGRSGRFGRKGAAFNFVVTTQDEGNMTKIERHFQRHATEVRWDNEGDFESALKDAGLA